MYLYLYMTNKYYTYTYMYIYVYSHLPSYSRESLGRHRKGTPGIGNAYKVCIKCFMSDHSLMM